MEATKKTSTTKAALLVIAALSMLLSGLFIATASRSDASPPPACPDGFSLTADAKNCFQAAVVTSADNPNSCSEGKLTPDGSKCYVAARILPQEGKTLCPAGYSPDDSLGGMCARFDAASQKDPGCPEGARGVAGGCYIRVAKGPAGTPTCPSGQTIAGSQCVETNGVPVSTTSSCPTSATVQNVGGECFTLISAPRDNATCIAAGGWFMFAGICKVSNTNTVQADIIAFTCPAGATGTTVTPNRHTIGNPAVTKIESCSYVPIAPAGSCPTGTSEDATPSNGFCRRPVDVTPDAKVCTAAGFTPLSGKCVKYNPATVASASCPAGSVEDSVGDCRKPVADSKGAYYCKDAASALNGKSCVWTAGFIADPAPTLYKCEKGARTVIGVGSSQQVICILGDANANTTTGPSCLQGVLSTDNAYCIVPRIDAAPAAAVYTAPVPSFTG